MKTDTPKTDHDQDQDSDLIAEIDLGADEFRTQEKPVEIVEKVPETRPVVAVPFVEIVRQPEPEKMPEAPEIVHGDWPEQARSNREAWLAEAARRMARNPDALDKVLFSVGYGKGGTRGAKLANVSDGKDGGKQVFVRPSVHDKPAAILAMYAAFCQLGADARALVHSADWPDYPQPEAKEEIKTQATRLLKCQCDVCKLVFRMTARWVPEGGEMICPDPACGGSVKAKGLNP